ncbi:hypothetical protein G9A89_001020 [Geosiphon pyriformis]|nr:hypothetical protein G9A89_001020 [Geosiphon pyriformis]
MFRCHTVVNLFALFGGALCLMKLIYTMIFGNELIQPWGLIHFYGCCFAKKTNRQIRELFPVLPMYDNTRLQYPITSDTDTLNQYILHLQRRYDSLELFLRDFVADASFLRQFRDVDGSSLTSSHLYTQVPRAVVENSDTTTRSGSENSETSSARQREETRSHPMRDSQITRAQFIPAFSEV